MKDATRPAPEFNRKDSSRFWDEWNREWRFRDRHDSFMQRQLDVAVSVARAAKLDGARILGIGCGTGWLENGLLPFGKVWGTDISEQAIADGQRRHPGVQLICCDFLGTDLPGSFDMVVSADSLVPMADHEMCIRRVAELLRPGGTFLLMTQNPPIWARRSKIRAVPDSVPHAEPDEWPTRRRIRTLMQSDFVVESVSTMDPGGDRALLWWVENDFVQGLAGRIVGDYRWRRLLENMGLGRELIVVARRR